MKEITKEQIKQFEAKVAAGVPNAYSVLALGMSQSSLYYAVAKAKDIIEQREAGIEVELSPAEENYLEILEAIKRGREKFIERNLLLIQVASQDSWQAAAWLLERKFPDEFGLKMQRFDETNDLNSVSKISDEELEKRYNRLLEKARDDRTVEALPSAD